MGIEHQIAAYSGQNQQKDQLRLPVEGVVLHWSIVPLRWEGMEEMVNQTRESRRGNLFTSGDLQIEKPAASMRRLVESRFLFLHLFFPY
jgi:hypothetical protein